jgi:hypothetical protein
MIESLISVDILSLKHQKSPPLGFISGAVGGGTGEQGT